MYRYILGAADAPGEMLLLRTIAIVLPLLLLKRITITPKILLILMQTVTAGGSSVRAGVFFGCGGFLLVMINVMQLMSLLFLFTADAWCSSCL